MAKTFPLSLGMRFPGTSQITSIQPPYALRWCLTTRNVPWSKCCQPCAAFKECWRLGYITVEQYQRAVDLERAVRKTMPQAQTGRHVEQEEVAALLKQCADGSLAGVRDAALIAIAYSCGLRRAELTALSLEDIDLAAMSLRVVGKGNKERIVYVGHDAALYLRAWLRGAADMPHAVFGRITKSGRLMPAHDKAAGDVFIPHMTDQAVYAIFKRRAEQALLDAFSSHDMRRTYAGNLLDAGRSGDRAETNGSL